MLGLISSQHSLFISLKKRKSMMNLFIIFTAKKLIKLVPFNDNCHTGTIKKPLIIGFRFYSKEM